MTRLALILALLAVSTLARSDGISNIGNLNSGFTGGLANFGSVAVVVPTCSGTGLIFNVACNSQYIPLF